MDKQEKILKIRCSELGIIMSNPRYTKADNDIISAGGWVNKLSESAKTYLRGKFMQDVYGRKSTIISKYMDKGTIVEDSSIEFLASQLGLGMIMKNEESKEDEWLTGTADIVLSDEIIDVKNSWSWSTFPLLTEEIPDPKYYWQLQGYMRLYGKQKSRLVYTLMNTPDELIEKEFKSQKWRLENLGYHVDDEDLWDDVMKDMTYLDVDDKLRIKTYEIPINDYDQENMVRRISEARKYYESLNTLLK